MWSEYGLPRQKRRRHFVSRRSRLRKLHCSRLRRTTLNRQSSVDSLIAAGGHPGDDVITPPEQDEIIHEANEIYERLLREAAEDEARKQAEIDEARIQAELKFN